MPSRFVVRLTPSFLRDLEALPPAVRARVIEAVRPLETIPCGPPPRIKKLKGKGVGQWRLEMWPYRVRYDIAGSDVVLHRVRHRAEIYRQ